MFASVAEKIRFMFFFILFIGVACQCRLSSGISFIVGCFVYIEPFCVCLSEFRCTYFVVIDYNTVQLPGWGEKSYLISTLTNTSDQE